MAAEATGIRTERPTYLMSKFQFCLTSAKQNKRLWSSSTENHILFVTRGITTLMERSSAVT